MEKPKVPKSFVLFGERHKVKLLKKVDRGRSLGEYIPDKNLIKLATQGTSSDSIEQTFYHELVHCMLHHTSYHKLSEDEKLVDLLGKCLHQLSKTTKY